MRIALLETGQPDELDQTSHPSLAFGAGEPHDLQSMPDIPPHGAPRQDGELLKDDAALASRAAHRLAVALDRAFARPNEAGNRLEQRGLAAAARAHEGDELAGANSEVDSVGCLYGSIGGIKEMPEPGHDNLAWSGHQLVQVCTALAALSRAATRLLSRRTALR